MTELNNVMKPHGLGFGYRVAEEFVRYHMFATAHLGSGSDDVIDQLLVQKVLVKLRGAERQRTLLTGIGQTCKGLARASEMVQRLLSDLDEFGSFQAMR
jgi:5-methylcytosine-specific restriction enzyme B